MARSAKPALHLIQPRRVCRRVVNVMFVRRVIVHNQVHVKLFRKTGVQGTAEMRREENQSDQIEHDQGQRPKAACNGAENR